MSGDPLFSEHWYRVKDLKPRLASDVTVQRHVYRDVPSYVLHRKSTGAFHRVDTLTFELVGVLDGTVSVNDAWERAIEAQGSQAPSQTDLIGLLAQLHEAELLTVNRKLNAEQLFNRGDSSDRRDARQRYLNPLYLRFALLDPDRMLSACLPLARLMFSRYALVALLGLVVFALIQLAPNWSTLKFEIARFDFFSPENAALFFITYPLLKLVHELAHGLAVKRQGGEVHEMGIALMVLLPIPYVDASAAAVFADKRHRMTVGAAGIFAELGIASVAALIWIATPAGLLHDLALLLLLVGGLSTLLFNGNPLLKFDGYYVLADFLEVPNLAERSKKFVLDRLRAMMFGLSKREPAPVDAWERVWLISYGTLSTLYRIGLMIGIAFMLSGKFFFFGMALAVWIAVTVVGQPLLNFMRFLLTQPKSSQARVTTVTLTVTGILVVCIGFVPIPYNSLALGVVWLPENAIIRAASDCEITDVMVTPGAPVDIGDVLFRCTAPEVETRVRILQAQLDAVAAQRAGLEVTDRVKRDQLRNEMNSISAQLTRTQEQADQQLVVAPTTGRFIAADRRALAGRFLKQGVTAAYVVPPQARTVRVAVEQSDISDVDDALQRVEIRFSEQPGAPYATNVRHQTPQASYQVVSAALTSTGGGELPVDATGDGRTVLEPVFDLELVWPANAPIVNVGSHVRVKFVHQAKPLAERLTAEVRRAFLGRLEA